MKDTTDRKNDIIIARSLHALCIMNEETFCIFQVENVRCSIIFYSRTHLLSSCLFLRFCFVWVQNVDTYFMEEHKLQVFGNKVLRKMCELKRGEASEE